MLKFRVILGYADYEVMVGPFPRRSHNGRRWNFFSLDEFRVGLLELFSPPCKHRRHFVGTVNMTAAYRCEECGVFSETPDKKRF